MILKHFRFFIGIGGNKKVQVKTICLLVLLAVSASTLLFSCGTVPQQTYLEKGKMSKFNAVAVSISSADLDVRYLKEKALWTPGLLGWIEYCVRSSMDQTHAKDIKNATGEFYIGKLFGGYFLEDLRGANQFKIIDCIDNLDISNYKNLRYKGYNAVIELNIKKLSLTPGIGDKILKVYVEVCSKMVDLEKEDVIWNRQLAMVSDEQYTIDEYKAEDIQIFKNLVDKMLKKAAYKLTNDIIYSR